MAGCPWAGSGLHRAVTSAWLWEGSESIYLTLVFCSVQGKMN